MDIVVGTIVRAKAGRDKGGYFVVTDVLSNDRVCICDGKRRKLESKKTKNIIHLEVTNTVTDKIETNRQIRSCLREFQGGK